MQGGTDAVLQVLSQIKLVTGSSDDVAAFWLQDWTGQRNFTSSAKDIGRVGLWWNWEVCNPSWEMLLFRCLDILLFRYCLYAMTYSIRNDVTASLQKDIIFSNRTIGKYTLIEQSPSFARLCMISVLVQFPSFLCILNNSL